MSLNLHRYVLLCFIGFLPEEGLLHYCRRVWEHTGAAAAPSLPEVGRRGAVSRQPATREAGDLVLGRPAWGMRSIHGLDACLASDQHRAGSALTPAAVSPMSKNLIH